MKKKGFTLIEVLAVITLLGIIAIITVVTIIKIVSNSRRDAFQDSVYAAIRSYENKDGYEGFYGIGELDISELPLDNNNFKSGKIKRGNDGLVEVVNVTDGNYCANGSRQGMTITEGDCN